MKLVSGPLDPEHYWFSDTIKIIIKLTSQYFSESQDSKTDPFLFYILSLSLTGYLQLDKNLVSILFLVTVVFFIPFCG